MCQAALLAQSRPVQPHRRGGRPWHKPRQALLPAHSGGALRQLWDSPLNRLEQRSRASPQFPQQERRLSQDRARENNAAQTWGLLQSCGQTPLGNCENQGRRTACWGPPLGWVALEPWGLSPAPGIPPLPHPPPRVPSFGAQGGIRALPPACKPTPLPSGSQLAALQLRGEAATSDSHPHDAVPPRQGDTPASVLGGLFHVR